MTTIKKVNKKTLFTIEEETKETQETPLFYLPSLNLTPEKDFLSKALDPSVREEINSLCKSIFERVSKHDMEEIKQNLFSITHLPTLSDEDFAHQLNRINRAYLFFIESIKTKKSNYKTIQLDKGNNFELSPDLKTKMVSPVANIANFIPVLGEMTASGLKKGLKFKSDQKRIKKASKKSMHMLIDKKIISFIAILLTNLHLAEIKETSIKESESYLIEKFKDFFSIAKKQMKKEAYPENLNDFWAKVFSTYLQSTIKDESSLEKFRDEQLKPLLNHCQKKELDLIASSEETFSAEDLQQLFHLPEKKSHPIPASIKEVSEETPLSSIHSLPLVNITSSFATWSELYPSPIIINLTLNITPFANQCVAPININLSNIIQNLSIPLFPSTTPVTLDANKTSYTHQSACIENPSTKMDALNPNPINMNPAYGQQIPYYSIAHPTHQRERFNEKNLVSIPSSLDPAFLQQKNSNASAITQFRSSHLNNREESKLIFLSKPPRVRSKLSIFVTAAASFFLFTRYQEKSHLHDKTPTQTNLPQINQNKREENPTQKNRFPFFARLRSNKNIHSIIETDSLSPGMVRG